MGAAHAREGRIVIGEKVKIEAIAYAFMIVANVTTAQHARCQLAIRTSGMIDWTSRGEHATFGSTHALHIPSCHVLASPCLSLPFLLKIILTA